MWCPCCRADVAAELSSDNRRMLCARCQTELGIAAAVLPSIGATPRTTEMERDARDLLARWSAQNLLDAPASSGTASSFAKPWNLPEPPTNKTPELRYDRPASAIPSPSAPYLAATKDRQDAPSVLPLDGPPARPEPKENTIPRRRSRRRRLEETSDRENPTIKSHSPNKPPIETPVSMNHDQSHREGQAHTARHRMGWTTLLGQLCAYIGVGLLTCGTVLAMWSYFGGPASYMPTGWLAATIGQMLLLLGVVTLISSGMDHTITEVTWRIDHLAEEIHHMGISLDELESEHRKARINRSRAARRRSDDGQSREAA